MSLNTTSPNKADAEVDDLARERFRQAVREGTGVAIRTACLWLPIAGAVLVAGLALAEDAFKAADENLADRGEFWQESFMPLVLFLMFGACAGLSLGWRIAGRSGLVGRPAMLVGAVAVAALLLVGVIGVAVIYESGIPDMAWLSLACMEAAALGGVAIFAMYRC